MSIHSRQRHSRPVLSHPPVRQAKGIRIVEKMGQDFYAYPEEVSAQPDSGSCRVTLFNPTHWPEHLAELDGFYCINTVTRTISYLGSEWCDIAPGLKFRGLATF